jgi:DNA-binding transcriptional ArsR family regulator
MDDELYKKMARVLKAVGNPSRLKILHRLGDGEATVGALTELTGLDQSTVSRHLAVLRSQGIVDDRRDGSNVRYRLLTPCVLEFFLCASKVVSER